MGVPSGMETAGRGGPALTAVLPGLPAFPAAEGTGADESGAVSGLF